MQQRVIRPAILEDVQDWVQMNREFMDFEIKDEELWNRKKDAGHGAAGTGFAAADDPDSCSESGELSKVFLEALNRPEQINLVMIEKDGKTVGFANLMTIFSVWAKGEALIIDDLYIREAYRGKGLGATAMKEIEDYAREAGFKRLQFCSEETNPEAKNFYVHLGYKPAGMSFYARYF